MRTIPAFFLAVLCAAATGAAAMAPAGDADKKGKAGELGLDLQGGAHGVFQYTSLDLEKCEVHPDSEAGYGRWTCKGIDDDWPVHVLQDDLRMTVSYGPNGHEERAAQQWFGPFNRVHDKIEWVLASEDGVEPRPVATILRFILEFMDEKTGETGREHPILVVTQLKVGAVCHVAYVDAHANKNANMDARLAALRLAGSYNCEAEPELVGPQTPDVFGE